jgi:hypothetical protein
VRLAFAAVAAVSVLAGACGGIENEPNLAKAVERTTASGSSRIEVRGGDGTAGEPGAYVCDGVADYARRRLQFTCTLDGDFVMAARALDGYVYFDESGTGDKWYRDKDDDENALSEFSPDKLLSMLREASSETVRIGEETVREASTVRYRLTVDREQADLGDGPGPTAEVDVWIDEDGLVRRISADDDSGEFIVDFFDFGVDADIEAPPPDQIAELDDLLTPKSCTVGKERPIRVEQALETLRGHDFDVERDEEGCKGGVAAVLTTRDDGRELEAVYREQGYVLCLVFIGAGVSGSGTGSVPAPGGDRARIVDRSLENLDCTLTVQGPKGDAHIQRLDRALEDLKRAIRP